MAYEISIKESLQRIKDDIFKGNNSCLRRHVITYRLDHKNKPRITSLGRIYINRHQIQDKHLYKVVYYSGEKEKMKELQRINKKLEEKQNYD